MKWWQIVIVVVLMFILFRTTTDNYVTLQTKVLNEESIDSLYVRPNIRNAEIFQYRSPSEWVEPLTTYAYLGPPQPDYYGDRPMHGIPFNNPVY